MWSFQRFVIYYLWIRICSIDYVAKHVKSQQVHLTCSAESENRIELRFEWKRISVNDDIKQLFQLAFMKFVPHLTLITSFYRTLDIFSRFHDSFPKANPDFIRITLLLFLRCCVELRLKSFASPLAQKITFLSSEFNTTTHKVRSKIPPSLS